MVQILPNFNHVADQRQRDILNSGDTSEDSLCSALTFARQSFTADANDSQLAETVGQEVIDLRGDLIQEAEDWWNEEGNADRAMNSLQQFWSV